jgi:hypothetical protein
MAIRWTEEDYVKLTGRRLNPKKTPAFSNPKQVVTAYKSNVKGWRTVGHKRYYFRSLWEIQFAQTLEYYKKTFNIKDWEFEPETFAFPKDKYKAGPFYYLPDFKVYENNGKVTWYEVKGYMTKDSKKKLTRFKKHYPKEKIIVISKKWFTQARKKGLHKIADWESLQ